MGIELYNNNRPVISRLIADNHLLSHSDNNALLIVDSADDVTLYITDVLPAGFTTRIIQRGVGKAIIATGGNITIVNQSAASTTLDAGDCMQILGTLPLEFLIQNIGSNNTTGGGGGGTYIKALETDFTDATDLDNALLASASDIAPFLQGINRFLEPDEYEITGTGMRVLLPAFDATVNPYSFVIFYKAPAPVEIPN